jgi:hypothetical protein
MKLRREVLIIAGVLLLLLVVTVASGLFQSKAEEIPALSSNSNKPDGARALRLWLAEAGYPVSNTSGAQFQVPAGSDVVLILEPMTDELITDNDWAVLDDWLKEGGTLLLAARQISAPLSNSPFQVYANFISAYSEPLYPAVPVFQAPPVVEPIRLTFYYALMPGPDEVYQPLLSTPRGPVALRLKRGAGSVILVSDSRFLTNQGLKEEGNAALALNLFALLPKGSQVWIDEWHHGERGAGSEAGYGPEAWLLGTPSGFALLFAAGVIFLGLLLAGRPFGRPVPLPQEQVRRASLEYVTALANLNRRAGHRRALLQYYHSTLKRSFGRRYRLDPGLPDPAYVAQLSHFNPTLDGPALLDLLQRLDRKEASELQVVQLAREAADWLNLLKR